MEAVLWRIYIVATALFLLLLGVRADTGGYLFFKFLCYKNPGHKVSNGDLCDTVPSIECDPYFTICIGISSLVTTPDADIRTENCQTYYSQTETYNNVESICDRNTDNRGELRYPVKRNLAYPLPNTFYVKIVVRETDGWTNNQPLIASFSAEFKQTPASNLSNPIFKEIAMYRNEFRYANPTASLKIAMALQCERNLFGDHCLTRCTDTPFYSCSGDGKKICKEGWTGESCADKDVCRYQLCAIGAKCVVIEKAAKCMCQDGTVGPRCYPNYDPCRSYVCLNGGLCNPNSTGKVIVCKCFFPYHGEHCELRMDVCGNSPCQNNGTCEMDVFGGQVCKCPEGFYGALCTVTNTTKLTNSTTAASSEIFMRVVDSKVVITLSVLFGLSIVCCVSVVLLYLYRRQRKRKFLILSKSLQPVKMKELEGKLTESRPAINEYTTNNTTECVYETVDDSKTYSYLRDSNDDYLVPSRPTTPRFDTYGAPETPVYLQMSGSGNVFSHDPLANRDSFDLPPLPSREFHRKLSLKNFCLS